MGSMGKWIEDGIQGWIINSKLLNKKVYEVFNIKIYIKVYMKLFCYVVDNIYLIYLVMQKFK